MAEKLNFTLETLKIFPFKMLESKPLARKNNMNTGVNPKTIQQAIRSEPTIEDLCSIYATDNIKKYYKSSGCNEKALKDTFRHSTTKKLLKLRTGWLVNCMLKLKMKDLLRKLIMQYKFLASGV